MTYLEHFHFLRPAWLLLVPVVVWIWWLVRVRQDPLRGWRAWMDRDLLAALTVGRIGNPSGDNANSSGRNTIPSYFYWRGVGLLVAWLTALVAVAGPTWRPERSPFADDPVPVMLVLHAGQSMNLADLAPSRMERARLKIADFAAERKGQPLGLIAYSGSAHLVLPPTRDTSVVAAMAAEIGPEVMPRPGNDLAAALRLAARTLCESGGSIVVLTDTAPPGNELVWREFRNECSWPVHFLAVARADTPEWDTLHRAAAALGASITQLTPDSADVLSLVRRTAKAPVAVAAAAEGTRWAEAGWWLVPLLALLSLATFRRVRDADAEHVASRATPLDDPTLEKPEETNA
ncbi:MAG: VWA domain-containing protein [Planctomycetes bacterium]|nr:VWA domain-containing protein [Planctomycetota bacterium]